MTKKKKVEKEKKEVPFDEIIGTLIEVPPKKLKGKVKRKRKHKRLNG